MPSNSPPLINLLDPKFVFAEIFDDDAWVKEMFAKHFTSELTKLSEVIAESFKWYPELQTSAQDEQAIYVAAFINGIFDDLITSSKLLVTGKLIPSGNLMRQAIEGVAVAILCSSRRLLLIPKSGCKKKTNIEIKYWERVKELDKRVDSNKALAHLELNKTILQVNNDAILELKKAVKLYHPYSHPSTTSLVLRNVETETEIKQFIGGMFNEALLPMYKVEIEQRTNLCSVLPNLIELVIVQLNAAPKKT
jgi:hypothetical protein